MQRGAGFASGSSGFQSCPLRSGRAGEGGQGGRGWGGLEAWSLSADLIDFSRFILGLIRKNLRGGTRPTSDVPVECSLMGSSGVLGIPFPKQNDLKMQQAVQMQAGTA